MAHPTPLRQTPRWFCVASKMLFVRTGDHLMDTRIVDRTIVTIQVISCLATIIVMGLIFTMVGTSIYGILVTVH